MSDPTKSNGVPDLAAESKAWEEQCTEAMAERDRLREELVQVKKARDSYLKSLYAFLRKEWPPPDFTKEELFAHLDDKPTIYDVIAELEAGLEKRP